ncbi:MAG: GIY-YIG nuclease family protein [Pseudomonadota bacterium]
MSRERANEDDAALLADLGIEAEAEAPPQYSNMEERLIAGLEEITSYVSKHGAKPIDEPGRDIFERIYAVRLSRLRAQLEHHELLASFDELSLLGDANEPKVAGSADNDDQVLLAELGLDADASISDLTHVRSSTERRAAEDIARPEICPDFDRFRNSFADVAQQIAAGNRKTKRFERKAEIKAERFYISQGQLAYVAEMGEPYVNENGNVDARLRVVFDNGTQRNLLMRSLQRSLQQDDTGRRVLEETAGPLFSEIELEHTQISDSADGHDDTERAGTIYVLQSRSDHPMIAPHRKTLHKIGVTRGEVRKRIANAPKEATYLFAGVDVVAEYEVFNIHAQKLEQQLHTVFGAARFTVSIPDRFGQQVKPREWFLVPLDVIDQAVELVRAGRLPHYSYDPQLADLVQSDLR